MFSNAADLLLWVIPAYLLLANGVGVFLCWKDKRAAQKHCWRIPEKTFFLTALLGGGAGVLWGMYRFRHKTKHWYFVVGIPAILLLEIALVLFILWKFFL